METFINWLVLVLSFASMVYALSKPPIKDWIIVFFLKEPVQKAPFWFEGKRIRS